MSEVHSILLYIEPKNLKKLQKGKTIQLSHEKLSHALSNNTNFELHMLKKHINALHRAHKNKKGYRLSANKIIGGKIHWKDIGNKIKNGLKSIVNNKTVQSIAKQGAKLALDAGTAYAGTQGYDVGAYNNLAKQAVDGQDIKNELINQAGKDAINMAKTKLNQYQMGQQGGNLGKDILKGFKKVVSNPLVQQLAMKGAMTMVLKNLNYL